MDIALIYMVAGISSRFGGEIKAFAKIGKNEESLIECSLKNALISEFSKIVFIVSRETEKAFREKFGNSYNNIPVFYALQKFDYLNRDKPWGTVDALCSALPFLNCPFVICNGDDLYGMNDFRQMFKHLSNKESNAMIGYRLNDVLSETGSVNRGIIDKWENGNVKNIIEIFSIEKNNFETNKLSEKDLCSMNLFGFQPEILELLKNVLEEFKEKNKNDRKIECLLPNEIGKLTSTGDIILEVYPALEKWHGLTYQEDVKKVKKKLAIVEDLSPSPYSRRQKREKLMSSAIIK